MYLKQINKTIDTIATITPLAPTAIPAKKKDTNQQSTNRFKTVMYLHVYTSKLNKSSNAIAFFVPELVFVYSLNVFYKGYGVYGICDSTLACFHIHVL